MPDARVTITDPGYKGRILAIHEDLAAVDAEELAEAYRGLSYPESCIQIDTPDLEAA